MIRLFIVLAGVFLLASCAGEIKNSGSIVYEENIFSLQEKESTKENVLELIGPPSYRSQYDQDTWYYLHETTSQLAFLKRKLIARNIYVIKFENNKIKKITYLDEQESRNVAFDEKRTKLFSPKRTLMEKIFTGTQYGF